MKKRNSKTIFAETLLELARHRPLDRITVKQIVEESGLSMQTFYNHFQDKSELILYIHQAEGDRNMEALRKNQITFSDLARNNLAFYMAHKDYMANAISNSPSSDPYIRQIADKAYRVFGEYLEELTGMHPLPAELDFALKMYIHAANAMYAEMAMNRISMPQEEFLTYLHNGMPPILRPYLFP